MTQTCFVLMGFGEKTDYRTQRKLNLDKTYIIIRRAVEACGMKCVRADDIIHSGVIDKPMYEQLLEADIAIADLSTVNENAIYELGVRHALRPHTTIVIAETQFCFPFDLNHVLIRPYEHLGSGIDFEEAERLKTELEQAIQTLANQNAPDSPVYTPLPDLVPPHRRDQPPDSPDLGDNPPEPPGDLFSQLLEKFHEARSAGDFEQARERAEQLTELQPRDTYLIQQHALVIYKSEMPDPTTALYDAKTLLEEKLSPQQSNDPETLGIWGAIHKRLWEWEQRQPYLEEALAAYERGFNLRRDYYTGINYAFLLNLRAALQSDPNEANADRVIAKRIRWQILNIVNEALENLPRNEHNQPDDPYEAYWLGATRLEALLGLGMLQELEDESALLFENAPESWMQATTTQQLNELYALLNTAEIKTAEQVVESV